jgi:UDPglucose 6-dehydrogenase
MSKIGFIGVGKLGMPCAETVARKGHDTKGYDVAPRSSEHITVVNSIEELVHDRDIVFIAVPTPHDPLYDGNAPTAHLEPKDFDYSIVRECIIEANKHMNSSQLLVLISTVLPGTTRREFIKHITNPRFVYNPYLIAMGSVAWDMVNPEMVMIGTQDGDANGDARELTDFYRTIMENDPRYVVGTWDECEAIKVFYNTFISAKIGLVNMIQDVAEAQGNINVDVVTDALAQSTMRIMGPQYMKAGMGDGGGCHPRDNIALRYMASELNLGYDLFDSIMGAREIQAKNIAKRLAYYATKHSLPVVIHGKAYKPNVPYVEGSYSMLIGSYLDERGIHHYYVDPLTGDTVIPSGPAVFLMAHSASTTYEYTGNTHVDKLYCEIPQGSIVIDPWRKFEKVDGITVYHYGNSRQN